MAGEIEQRRADGPGRADHENGSARGQAPAAGEHLECGEIGERNAHRFRGVDPVGHGDEKTNGADRILRVAADDREIGDPYALARRSHARPGLVDDADEIVAGGERQRPLEIGIAAHADEGVGEARAGGQHLDADLARAGLGKDRFFDELQDLGPAESINANAPPGHEPPSSLRGMQRRRVALTSLSEKAESVGRADIDGARQPRRLAQNMVYGEDFAR